MNINEAPDIPKVAVIIATYNFRPFIKDCLRSVQNQDYPQSHIYTIVVDDASTDDTIKDIIPEKDAPTYSDEEKNVYEYGNFIYIQLKKNGGPSRARNIGIKWVSEKVHIITILDADDMMMPKKISLLLKPILQDPEKVAITYADYLILNQYGNLSYESKYPYSLSDLYRESIVHSGFMVQKRVLDQIGGYDEQLMTCEDYDLIARIANFFMIHHVPIPLSIVRAHNNSSVHYRSNEEWNRCYTVVKQRMISGKI